MHGRAYNRTRYLDERKAMMQAWSDYLDLLKAKIFAEYLAFIELDFYLLLLLIVSFAHNNWLPVKK